MNRQDSIYELINGILIPLGAGAYGEGDNLDIKELLNDIKNVVVEQLDNWEEYDFG